MRKLTFVFAWLCAVSFVVTTNPGRAAGSNLVSYVSAAGLDTNDCHSPAAACATIFHALTQTDNFGEIDCVSTGDFDYLAAVVITQSVTIDCAGAVAFTAGNMTINGAGIVVRLRNISFNVIGNGGFSIEAQNMAALYVENCVITNSNKSQIFAMGPFIGIKFEPMADAKLFVSNSIISNNGDISNPVSGGIYIDPASGVNATVSVDRSQITDNRFGIVGDARSGGIIRATVTDSIVSGNLLNGVTALTSGSSVWFLLDQTKVTGNTYGLAAGGNGAKILARNTSVFNNTTGLFTNNGGALYTYGNNTVNGNTTNGAFTGTVALQ